MSKDTRLRELLANVMPSLVKDFPTPSDPTPPLPPPVLFTNVSEASPRGGEKKHVRFTVKPSKAKTKSVMVSNARGVRHVVPLHTPTLLFERDE